MSKTAENIPELQNEEQTEEQRSQAPKPGRNDVETLRKAKGEEAKSDVVDHNIRTPKRTDSSNRSFGS